MTTLGPTHEQNVCVMQGTQLTSLSGHDNNKSASITLQLQLTITFTID